MRYYSNLQLPLLFLLVLFAEIFAGRAPPCEDPGVCGPYSQCLQVDNLKRRSEDSGFDWSQTISRALKKWQARPDPNHSNVGNTNGTAQTVLCACMPHHIGAPPKCRPLSCAANADCPSQFSCVKGLCKDPCQGICGVGAECKVVNHFPVCRCLRGFNGDPFFQCKASYCNDNEQCPADLACKGNNCRDPCEGVKCGANAKCWVVRHHATCVCVPGYTGNPFDACAAVVEDEIAARCNLDVDCQPNEACVNGYCRDPCVGYCKGLWKKCEVIEHKPRCNCEVNTYPADDGNCLLNSGSYCGRDPIRVCGQNSQCIESTVGPVCRCLAGYVGNPPNCKACVSAFECGKSDQTCLNGRCVHACTTMHCASNAVCVVEEGNPECKCLKGYEGDGIAECVKVKTPMNLTACENDTQCIGTESCINAKCQSPCIGTCGNAAECIIRNRIPSCYCPAGFTGDPYFWCVQVPPRPPFEGDECDTDADCPDDMSCGLHGFCVNPCNHVCAVHTGAKCEAKRHRATCWCPNVGQPWKRCFSAQEVNSTSTVGHAGPYSLVNKRRVGPCNPSPCGTMASCHVSRSRAVCHCLPGYNGIPPACTPKCFKDHDCPSNMACIHGQCGDPCHSKCSRNEYTFCTVIDHKPMCVDATNENLLLRVANNNNG
ncbi:neurogenic locus notch homolog protein 2 [Folsomia candida]|uniref:Teneurin-3 n=1 Tax=Folsomia candida TaxID=158441 RepID=A0A226ENR5_FOLCA|nr:neurogenic locus notch homolog protein 2 [Folsomia candida]OXA59283.1 Teneurin-3 [Folsomia candida]